MKTWKIAGINFDHMHMGDLLRLVHEHPEAEIAGICDEEPARMEGAARNFAIPSERQFTDYRECLEKTQPDIAILCPATARHGEYVQKVAPYGVHILVEKPMAASLADARCDDPGSGGNRQDAGHQLAAGLVSAARDHEAPHR